MGRSRGSQRSRAIVLLTDFGPQGPYVGQMKLAIERTAPGVRVIDLAHDIPPQDVSAAALILAGAASYLPSPCVVCAVVDPAVGTARRLLAAEFRGGLRVLAPDNGLLHAFDALGRPARLHAVTNRALFLRAVSPVFHGRDILAPVAARLAAGLDIARVGPSIAWDSLAVPPWPSARRMGSRIQGQVIYVDRFGNLITNLRATDLPRKKAIRVRCRGRRMPWHTCYAEAKVGTALALIGSFGFLEIAVRDGSAAKILRAKRGSSVEVWEDAKSGS